MQKSFEQPSKLCQLSVSPSSSNGPSSAFWLHCFTSAMSRSRKHGLGIDKAEFKKWTVKKQISTRSEKIITALNAAQATVVRDSVAKFVYVCLFEWLVAIVNESLAGENGEAEKRAEMFIGVLDIYGFEHFQKVLSPNVLCGFGFVTIPPTEFL
jgi:hypothetical protein